MSLLRKFSSRQSINGFLSLSLNTSPLTLPHHITSQHTFAGYSPLHSYQSTSTTQQPAAPHSNQQHHTAASKMANPVNFPNQYIQYENTGLPNQYIQHENTGLPNKYIQHENTGLPNQSQAVAPVAAKSPKPRRRNCHGGGPGYDPTVSLTLQFPSRTDKANVFLRVRSTALGGQACPMEDPQAPRTSQKCQKVLTMTSQRYVTTDCYCLETSLHADTQQQKKGRPEGAQNKEKIAPEGPEAFLPTPDSSNSPNEDGGSQLPTSTIYHTAPLLPPLATTVAQPTSRPVGHAQTTGSPEEKWGGDLLREYPGTNIPLLDADSYNYGDYGNYGNSCSSSLYSYPTQAPVNLTGYQPYDTPTPTISQGYDAPSSSIDTNIKRLRAQSSLNPKATAAAQDNFTSPLNLWEQTDDYLFYPGLDPFSFDNNLWGI